MSREFKKSFFMSLIAVLLVVSNLLGMKLTNFFDITIGVDFVTYPFTFLCTLLIINFGNKKEAYKSILIAGVIQLLITISYAFATSFGTQIVMPDASVHVNEVFKVSQINILSNVLAFLASHCLLIYIYDNFKHYGKELYGIVIGLLGSMFLYSVMYLVISLSDYDSVFVINMLLSNIIINVVMVIIVTILYYILRDKEEEVIESKKIVDGDKIKNKIIKRKNSTTNNRKNIPVKNTKIEKNESSKKITTSKQKVNRTKK